MKSIILLIIGAFVGFGAAWYFSVWLFLSFHQFQLHTAVVQKHSHITSLESGKIDQIVDILKSDIDCIAKTAAEMEQVNWMFPLEKVSTNLQEIAELYQMRCRMPVRAPAFLDTSAFD